MKLRDIRLSTRITLITLLVVGAGVAAFLLFEWAYYREAFINEPGIDLEEGVAAGLLAMLLICGIALFALRSAFSPLEQIAAAANRIAAGEQDISLPESSGEIGSLTRALGAMLEKLRQREELLRKSETMLRESQRMAQIGSWELDLVNNVLSWSDENYRIFEIDRTRFGASYEAFLNTVHPDDRAMVNRAYNDSVKNRTPYDIVHRLLFPGQRIKYAREWCETAYDQEGRPIRSIGTTQDVTAHKMDEEALRASESRYRLLVESSPFCIHEIDLEGRLQSMNRAGLGMLGLGSEEAIRGMPYLDVVSRQDAERVGALLRDAIASGTTSHFEFAAAGDVPLYFKSCFIPIKDAGGKVLKLMGLTEDITGRRQQEKARAAMTNTGRFNIAGETTSSLTHELSQPLTACNNYLDVCLRRMNEKEWDKEKIMDTLQLAYKQAGRVGEIINRFKGAVKKQELEYTLFDVNLLAREAMDFMAGEIKSQGISVHMVLFPLPQVMARREEIRQVLLNLCENAIEAMHHSVQRDLRVTTSTIETGHILVAVSDSGEGIPPARMETLFEPFQSSKEGRLGLNLSICRSIVERHGGRIWADTQRESGAEFYFTLPVEAHHE